MLLSAYATYLIMARLEERVREAYYWVIQPGNKGTPLDTTLLHCLLAVTSLVCVGIGIYIFHEINNPQRLIPSSIAFHFAVSLFLASEYVLYMLNKFGLLILDEKKGEN
jgi:hypothetical protein